MPSSSLKVIIRRFHRARDKNRAYNLCRVPLDCKRLFARPDKKYTRGRETMTIVPVELVLMFLALTATLLTLVGFVSLFSFYIYRGRLQKKRRLAA